MWRAEPRDHGGTEVSGDRAEEEGSGRLDRARVRMRRRPGDRAEGRGDIEMSKHACHSSAAQRSPPQASGQDATHQPASPRTLLMVVALFFARPWLGSRGRSRSPSLDRVQASVRSSVSTCPRLRPCAHPFPGSTVALARVRVCRAPTSFRLERTGSDTCHTRGRREPASLRSRRSAIPCPRAGRGRPAASRRRSATP